MDINKADRLTLKSYFRKNLIPTEGNFADLLDGMLNQKDDGIAKLPGDPLSIAAAGDAPQRLVNFYGSFADPAPAWTLQMAPRDAANKPCDGFSVSDGQGTSRLFIDKATGNVGIGTLSPAANARLTLAGGALAIGGPNPQRADAALHVTASFGGFDRLLQMMPSEASKPGLSIVASRSAEGEEQWWAWGVTVDNKWRINAGAGFSDQSGMTITPAGYVGIGTAQPATPLHIVTQPGADAPGYGNPMAWGQHIEFAATGMWGLSNSYGILHTWDSDSLFIGLKSEGANRKDAVIVFGDDYNDSLRFLFAPAGNPGPAPVECMAIKSDGKVGIGIVNPSCKLDVAGTINAVNAQPIRQQMVHRRVIFGVAGDAPIAHGISFAAVRSPIYGPFSYGMPAVQAGATRRYRLYAVYSDNMTTAGENIVRFTFDGGAAVEFSLFRTWGDPNIMRDGYSNWIDGPVSTNHGSVWIRTTASGTTGRLWYLELQAFDNF